MDWFQEKYKGIVSTGIRIEKILHEEETPHQGIQVYDTVHHGRMLALDGMVMLTEKDEFIYHEMLAHTAMCSHPCPNKILVIGGGDGGTVREVFKHSVEVELSERYRDPCGPSHLPPDFTTVTVCEIDERVVEVSKRYFQDVAQGFSDGTVEFHFEDAAKYLKELPDHEKFNVVIIDSSDPQGPAESLFTEEFFKLVKDRMSSDGVMTMQMGSPVYASHEIRRISENMREAFRFVHGFRATIPTYPGGEWLFGFVSLGSSLSSILEMPDWLVNRWRVIDGDLRYFSLGVMKASFELPPYIQKLVYSR